MAMTSQELAILERAYGNIGQSIFLMIKRQSGQPNYSKYTSLTINDNIEAVLDEICKNINVYVRHYEILDTK